MYCKNTCLGFVIVISHNINGRAKINWASTKLGGRYVPFGCVLH